MNPNDLPLDAIESRPQTLSAPSVEAAVLSIIVSFPDMLDQYGDRLTADCFTVTENKLIFTAALKQISAGKGCDVVSLIGELGGRVDPIYIHETVTSHDYSARGIAAHVEKLADLYQARSLHATSFKLAELAYSNAPIAERIDAAQAAVQALEVQGGEDEWVDAYTAAVQHSELIEKRERGEVSGLATGYTDLDAMLDGGPVRGNLMVIGARPAQGKTALAMSIGLSMASGLAVGFVSIEMPHTDVRDRQTAILGRLAIGDIKRPKRGDGLDYNKVLDAVDRSRNLRWNVTAKSSLNIQQLRSMARKLKRTRGLDVLMVDYIGLMSGIPGKNYGANRVYEIQDITMGMKSLAKELDIAVIALAQVNRGSDPKRPPGLRDLRDSGSIEQDADIVAFIHRPIQEQPELGEKFKNYALLRVAKNRQGATGDVHLYYRGEVTGFEGWMGEAPREPLAAEMKPMKSFKKGMEF